MSEAMKKCKDKAKGAARMCREKTVELYHFAIKNPFSVYFLLFLKPIVDMFYTISILDYLLLAYAVAVLAYNIIKRPNIFKRFQLLDYLCFVIILLMLISFLRNASGESFRIFVKMASQFILFFIGRYCLEETEKCLQAIRASSIIVVTINACILIIGILGIVISGSGIGFKIWGETLTFHGTYSFKTDLALAMVQSLVFILFVKKLRWWNYLLSVLVVMMIYLANSRISLPIVFIVIALAVLYKISKYFKRRIKIFDLRFITAVALGAATAILCIMFLSKLPIMENLKQLSFNLEEQTDPDSYLTPDIDDDTALGNMTDDDNDEFTFSTIKAKILGVWKRLYTPANTQGRSYIWGVLMEKFATHNIMSKLFGVDFVFDIIPELWANAENSYLKILFSTGIVGLLLFFVFLTIIIIKLYKNIPKKTFFIICALLSMLLIAGLTDPVCEQPRKVWITMFFLGLLFRRDPQPHDEEKAEPAPKKYIIDYIPVEKTASLLSSIEFSIAMAIAAGAVVIGKWQVGGVVAFVLIICAMLILCRDITVTTAPFLYICVFACMKYDSFNVYVKLWWLAIPALYALIFHFVKYRQPIIIGKSFWGILAVSFAVTLGGVGFISAKEYFTPIALYYTLGLGFGMLLCYLVIKSQIGNVNTEMARKRLLCALYCMGLIAALCVFIQYIWDWELFTTTGQVLKELISRNNFSTFIIFALPVTFYFAVKNPWHLISSLIMFAGNILSGSRGGMIACTIELVMCIAYLIIFTKGRTKRIVYASVTAVCIIVAIATMNQFLSFWNARYGGANVAFEDDLRNDVRFHFLFGNKVTGEQGSRVIKNFLDNPMFGQGLGSTANLDIYTPKKGALCWYHMMIPQIIGSLGIAGILAFGYQIISRIWMAAKRLKPFTICLALSYFGVFMMSQVNPGELCPLPYELLVVMLFIFIENEDEDTAFWKKLSAGIARLFGKKSDARQAAAAAADGVTDSVSDVSDTGNVKEDTAQNAERATQNE